MGLNRVDSELSRRKQIACARKENLSMAHMCGCHSGTEAFIVTTWQDNNT